MAKMVPPEEQRYNEAWHYWACRRLACPQRCLTTGFMRVATA